MEFSTIRMLVSGSNNTARSRGFGQLFPGNTLTRKLWKVLSYLPFIPNMVFRHTCRHSSRIATRWRNSVNDAGLFLRGNGATGSLFSTFLFVTFLKRARPGLYESHAPTHTRSHPVMTCLALISLGAIYTGADLSFARVIVYSIAFFFV